MEEAAQPVEFDTFASVYDSLRQGFILQHVCLQLLSLTINVAYLFIYLFFTTKPEFHSLNQIVGGKKIGPKSVATTRRRRP
jgi:hypothetical protein